MGPYATGAILSAMGVAQRYNKVLVHHTLGIPSLAKYDMQFPAWSLGSDPATTVPNTHLRRARRRPEAAEDGRRRHQQVPVDPVHDGRRARGDEEARPHRGAVPRVGLRQPRLRPDRQPRQGRQARLRLGRRDRPRRQPAARRDEEDRLRAAAALLPLPRARAAGLAAGGEERALGDDLRGPAAVHRRRRAPPSSSSSTASAPPRPASPTRRSRRRRRRRTPPGRSSRPASSRPRASTTRRSRPG